MRFRPVNAGVGDALSVEQWLTGNELLRTCHQIAFDHGADDVWVAGGDLSGDVVANDGLAAVIFAAIGVAEVDHDAGRDSRFFHAGRSVGDTIGRVVHGFAAPAQNDVAIGISAGHKDGRLPVMRMAKKGV